MMSSMVLEDSKIRLEPLGIHHEKALAELVTDGELWKLLITSAPRPEDSLSYINQALETEDRCAFAVIDKVSETFAGVTSFYDISPTIKRLDIGYTFYGQSFWRSHVNTHCKLLLLTQAFETLKYNTVGWQTDILNTQSQVAIERLGAKKDGVMRGHKLRKDGTIRDTVMYSMISEEWALVKERLIDKLYSFENKHNI